MHNAFNPFKRVKVNSRDLFFGFAVVLQDKLYIMTKTQPRTGVVCVCVYVYVWLSCQTSRTKNHTIMIVNTFDRDT